jgi:hypothetical protein
MSERIGEHIRSHVWGLIAVFVALTGTAIAAGGEGGTNAAKSANPAKQVKQLKRKLASVEQRLAALEGRVTPTIPASLPPSGPAGGELAGTYPSPSIGTISGLDLASSTSPTAGINFGADTSLFRSTSNQLRTNDNVIIDGTFDTRGLTFLGFETDDETQVTGYLRLRTSGTDPPAGDCNGPQSGRLIYQSSANQLWVCDGSVWLQIPAS